MLKREEPRFSEDEEQRPLMAEKELRDACLYAAAIVVVAFSLGCEFEDCLIDDGGYPWPTAMTRIDIEYPKKWTREEALAGAGAIHEAGAMAVAKLHDLGPCRINNSWSQRLFDDSTMWATIKALARFIQDNGDSENGCGIYGALGTDGHELGEDSDAIALIRSMGVYPGLGWKIIWPDDDDPRGPRPEYGGGRGGDGSVNQLLAENPTPDSTRKEPAQ